MALFDLDRFREVAFWGGARPDHPLATAADAEKILAALPRHDPAAALGELTAWAKSMNEADGFTPVRRARILLRLDDAARLLWRELSLRYLAPDGRPLGRDGDPNILRAMFDSASELTNGFGIALDGAGEDSAVWLEKNVSRIYVRNMRWLGRRLALAYMLRLPVSDAIWERIHRLHGIAELTRIARQPVAVFEGNRFPSSVRQEYVRALLLDLADPDAMPGRQIELAYRVTGRVAGNVRLEDKPGASTPFAVIPAGAARPTAASRLGGAVALFIDTSGALPKLQAALERDKGADPAAPDETYGGEFTLAERFAMMRRLLERWGMNPPQRRAKRVALTSPARVISGFAQVVQVLPAPRGNPEAERPVDLQIRIDETTQSLSRAKLRAASRVGPARVIDASNGGLGIALRRTEARWAVHDALVAVLIEPGKDWVVGVIRRIFSIDDEVRLGVQVLSTNAHALALGIDASLRETVWEDAVKHEASFGERYRKGIWLAKGDMLLEPRLTSKGSRFHVPQAGGALRVHVTRVLHESEHYQRVLFEKLA